MIALAPVVADALVAVDNQRIDTELMQARGDRQPGLSSADNNDGWVVICVAARFG